MEELNLLERKVQIAIERLTNELNNNLENALIKALREHNVIIKTKAALIRLAQEGRLKKFTPKDSPIEIYLLDETISLLQVNKTTKIEIENNLFTITIGF